MRTLLKMLLFFVGAAVVTRLAGLVVTRQLNEGSEVSDEFRRVVIMDGAEFTSQAGGLRHGEMSVLLGGAKLDLRAATLDPAGATLLVDNTLGGIQVLVRDDWAVTVDEELVGGGDTTIEVPSPDDLPEDAPKLVLKLMTRLGGSQVTTTDQVFG